MGNPIHKILRTKLSKPKHEMTIQEYVTRQWAREPYVTQGQDSMWDSEPTPTNYVARDATQRQILRSISPMPEVQHATAYDWHPLDLLRANIPVSSAELECRQVMDSIELSDVRQLRAAVLDEWLSSPIQRYGHTIRIQGDQR